MRSFYVRIRGLLNHQRLGPSTPFAFLQFIRRLFSMSGLSRAPNQVSSAARRVDFIILVSSERVGDRCLQTCATCFGAALRLSTIIAGCLIVVALLYTVRVEGSNLMLHLSSFVTNDAAPPAVPAHGSFDSDGEQLPPSTPSTAPPTPESIEPDGGMQLPASAPVDGVTPVVKVAAPPAPECDLQTFWPPSSRPAWESMTWDNGPPLSPEALNRSFHPPATLEMWCPWVQAAAAAAEEKPLSIVILGGSVTLGGNCGPDKLLCSWPRLVADWLLRVRPQWHVSVRNLAQGAIGTLEWLHRPIPGAPPDIIIIDTSNNAFPHEPGTILSSTDKFLWRLLHGPRPPAWVGRGPPALLYLEVRGS